MMPLASCLLLILPSCADSRANEQRQLRPDAPTLATNADWDDADAAVYASAEKIEAAVVRVVTVSDTYHQYHLRRTTGERGVLDIHRASAAASDPTDLTMSCSIGRIGDPRREKQLMDAVAARLKKLRGVDYAPLD